MTVREVLKRQDVPPAPQRGPRGVSWRAFLARHKHQFLACDFFTVEMLFLKTVYVLYFLEVGTRRVHLAGFTDHPTAARVTQKAPNPVSALQAAASLAASSPITVTRSSRRRSKAVLAAEGSEVMRTPFRAPSANAYAYAERWIRAAREECLDRLLVVSESHLRRMLTAYAANFNQERSDQRFGQIIPLAPTPCPQVGPFRCRAVIGGLLNNYFREAA